MRRLWCCATLGAAFEVLPPPGTAPTPVAAALPTILALAHAGTDDAAYAVAGTLLVGVPADAALAPPAAETWVLPHAVDGAAQAAVRAAAPGATRVVHRLDAGRGDYRRDDADTLLSAAGANLRPGAQVTSRKVDDGPWPLPGALSLVARWTPGPTQGHCVLRADVGGARVLFSGRLVGYDPDTETVSAFALEAEHSAARASEALFALADEEDEAWDFEWLLPARGRAVRFENPTTARDALRGAARRAASVARAGKG